MSKKDSKKVSETDWDRLAAMTDADIDTSDIPPLDDTFFATAKRRPPGKSRITIYIDDETLAEFRARAEAAGAGYQTLINEALREYLAHQPAPLTEEIVRRVVREELQSADLKKAA